MSESETRDEQRGEEEESESSSGSEEQASAEGEGHGDEEATAAQKAQEKHEAAQEKMKELEEMDEPPVKLEDWPDDQAKYVTYGGAEGDHSYAEGPESKLGPSDLERKADGSVAIEGEDVDNPDDYKAEPVPGGPTDPDSTEMPGERKKLEKMKDMYGDDAEIPQAVKEVREKRGQREDGEGESSGEDDRPDEKERSDEED